MPALHGHPLANSSIIKRLIFKPMIVYILLFIALTWLALFTLVLFEKVREHLSVMKERKELAMSTESRMIS